MTLGLAPGGPVAKINPTLLLNFIMSQNQIELRHSTPQAS
jgi:hypothetical protein